MPKTPKAAEATEEIAEEQEAVATEDVAARKAAKKARKALKAQEEAAAAVEEKAEEPAPKAKKSKEAKAEKAADAEEGEDAASEPAPKKQKVSEAGEELKVFVGGIPFSCDKATLTKDFAECGEIEDLHLPMNFEEGTPRGFAFITFKTKEGVEAALKFDGTDYGGRFLKVNVAGAKGAKGEGKGKGKGKGNEELTAVVKGLPWSTEEDQLQKDFGECGEIEKLRMPLNEEGKPRGLAFIEFKTKEGMEAALKFNETDYGGRTIRVEQAGQGKGGKDGKGKGKDGKGKGKDGKGKGKGKDGKGKGKAPVEFAGVKRKLEDSDDE